MYEIIWQVETGNRVSTRKDCQSGPDQYGFVYIPHSYEEVLDGFINPEVVETGDDLVIWETSKTGFLAAEGWRRV